MVGSCCASNLTLRVDLEITPLVVDYVHSTPSRALTIICETHHVLIIFNSKYTKRLTTAWFLSCLSVPVETTTTFRFGFMLECFNCSVSVHLKPTVSFFLHLLPTINDSVTKTWFSGLYPAWMETNVCLCNNKYTSIVQWYCIINLTTFKTLDPKNTFHKSMVPYSASHICIRRNNVLQLCGNSV